MSIKLEKLKFGVVMLPLDRPVCGQPAPDGPFLSPQAAEAYATAAIGTGKSEAYATAAIGTGKFRNCQIIQWPEGHTPENTVEGFRPA